MNVHDLLTDEANTMCPLSPATSVYSSSSSSDSSSSLSGEKRGWVAPFLLHLHQLLRREDSKIIRWAEDGMAFQILDKEAMTSQILPKYFKNKNFSSFQRQLNYFGFRKWSKARAQFPTYSREHFKRDNFSEMSLVKRQSKKSRKRKIASDEEMPAKRAAVQPIDWAVNVKFTPILPRPISNPKAAMAAYTQKKPRIISPLMQPVPLCSLPMLSPSRKMNSGYKLPSIRELSLSSAMLYADVGPIRTRLMA
ncbi:hypothetical protein DD237_000088 [Peronospora effusa]|uniref:HSF-type DNA-binding domain-containing protein n=1 Tax=Peronospora effusa TaxID=542832 RepID=A0A3R7YE82_9STRA|nr:hypothetical protein DD237_000088 [Peronospora effusa]